MTQDVTRRVTEAGGEQAQDERQRRWERLEEAFHRLADAPAPQQREAIALLERTDPDFAAELSAMLQADEAGDVLLDRGIAVAATDLLAADLPLPAQSFGAYRLERVIGVGGSGVVYLARRDDLQSVAAIKVLRDAWLSPHRRARFQHEQRTLAALAHPNIVRLFEADHLPDGTPWFALEYVDGQPITDWCRAQAPTLATRLAQFAQVCEAVRYAHGRGVIHRDLKPSNILVDTTGQVKLLDFGIAGRLRANAERTETGVRAMTPAYASPEQLRGEAADVRQDVYALGIVLFELLTGERPYDVRMLSPPDAAALLQARGAPSLLAHGAARTFLQHSRLSPLRQRDLDALVSTALHPDAERRYASVDALLRDLEAFAEGAPLAARRDSWSERLRRTLRRRRRELSVVTIVVVLPLIVAATYTSALTRARDAATAESQRTARLTAFLTRLLSGDEEASGPSDTLRVVTVVEEAVREARALTGNDTARADLLVLLGRVVLQLGRTALADTLLAEGEAEQRRLYPGTSRRAVEAAVLRAQIITQRGAADSAVRLLRAQHSVVRGAAPPDSEALVMVLDGLGAAYQETGALDSATHALEQVVALRQAQDTAALPFAEALTALSNVLFYRSNYDSSRTLALRSLRIAERVMGTNHPSLSENLVNLGMVALRMGVPADGEPPLRRALAVVEGWYGQAHPKTAGVITQLAQVLMENEQTPEALTLLERAVRIQRERFGTSSPRYASAVNTLAIAVGRSGDRERELALTREAHATYARANGPDHFFTLVVAGNLGSMLSRMGRHEEAAAVLADAVARFNRTVSPTDQNRAIALLRFGQARWRAGRYRDAIALTEEGLAAYRATATSPTGFSKAGSAVLAKSYAALGDTTRAARAARDSL